MNDTILFDYLCRNLGYPPTDDQTEAIKKLSEYICSNSNDVIFLLTGYAGTGKTSLISALVNTLDQLQMKSVLLAPTGRAAKVLASYSNKKTSTIHKKIYRQQAIREGESLFALDKNKARNTWFIVDESSMISNTSGELSIFGSGRLLEDLVEYVYTGTDCKLILVGDTAQLPPVGVDTSPALDRKCLECFGFAIAHAELRQVVRQSQESGILMNATQIRMKILMNDLSTPKIDYCNYKDIVRLSGNDLIDELSESYDKYGLEGTIIVVNSNKQANMYNQGIRNNIFSREEEISVGDIVMIVKNNYMLVDESDESGPGFIANGDIAEIKRIRKYEERYGFRFASMELYFQDYDLEVESKVLLDVLHLDSPALPSVKAKEFFYAVEADYMHLTSKKKRYDAMKKDPYYNALQIKFAYAVTCHKAQGGQWKQVFVDQGMFNKIPVTIDYLRWFYTSITRATKRLFLINFPDQWFD